MVQPIVLLIAAMSFTSLPPAVADHLSVFGIGHALLAPVLVTPLGLTRRSTANGLVGTVFGRLEGLLAIRAAAWRDNHFLRGMFGPQPLRKADPSARRRRYRVWCRVPTASSPMGSHANAAGAAGAGQHRLKWRHFSPALTGEQRFVESHQNRVLERCSARLAVASSAHVGMGTPEAPQFSAPCTC